MTPAATPTSRPGLACRAVEHIGRMLAVGGLILMGVTWRLWTPQNLFPRIPALESVTRWPRELVATTDWIALSLCVAALVYLAISKNGRLAQAAVLVVAAAFLALVVLDQHRLQPWIVHIAFGLLLANFARPARRIVYLRWFTASIYVYSALGKFDAQFLHTVGQDFIGILLAQIGWDIKLFSPPARFWMAAGLPIAELIVGCGLAIGRTQCAAALVAVAMHLLLISALGPWGLQHAWGVLAWNALFIALDVWLFIWPTATATGGESDSTVPVRGRFGWIEAVLIVALVAPLGERVGLIDHWLGWALYAPHSSRVHVEVAAGAVQRLPSVVQPFIEEESETELIWREVRIDRWSLATLGAPVYPQQRFQLGVARALAERVGERDLRVHLLSTASRWSGRRTTRTIDGRGELEAAARNYWFNTQPIFAPTR